MLKYKFFCIMIFFTLISSLYIGVSKEVSYPLLGKVIYIDPGHVGVDPGAVYKDTYEKKINLDISLKITDKLENLGATVYMTRYGDYDLSVKHTNNTKRSDLSRRSLIMNESKADMYMSIHLNSELNNSYSGLQIFYNDVNEENKNIAKLFQNQFKKEMNNIKEYKEIKDLYLYENTKIPGVLLELGYLSNPNDRYKLKTETYQQKIAIIISNCVNNYFDKKIP